MAKFPKDENRVYLYSIYCKVKERIHGETSHAISIKRCKCMCGWVDGYDLLLEVIAFLSRIIPMSLFFETWLSLFLSLFFLGHASLACHLFSFWGNHNLTLFYFRDVLRERSPRHGALIMWNEWVAVPIPSVGM